MTSVVVSGALIKLYVNETEYHEVDQISWNISYSEDPIYGIDSVFPQEIMPNRVSVSGTITGMRVKYTGGLQGKGALPLITDIQKSPYISIRVADKTTGEDLFYIQEGKVNSQSTSIAAKGIAKTSFNFIGMVPIETLDRFNGSTP